MWPWGHAAVGYLLYRVLGRTSGRTGGDGPPSGPAVVALGVGTQFPDLVDKPLSWSFDLLPAGRTLAHSALIGAVFVAGLTVVATRYEGRPARAGTTSATVSGDGGRTRAGTEAGAGAGIVGRLVPTPSLVGAFGLGYASHLLADVPPAAFLGDVAGAGFLLWPVVPASVFAGEESWGAHFPPEVTPFFLFQAVLTGLAVAVWVADGAPGLGTLRRLAARGWPS